MTERISIGFYSCELAYVCQFSCTVLHTAARKRRQLQSVGGRSSAFQPPHTLSRLHAPLQPAASLAQAQPHCCTRFSSAFACFIGRSRSGYAPSR